MNLLKYSGITFFLSISALAANAPLRLIETELNQKKWMQPQEIAELQKSSHQQGRCGGFIDRTHSRPLLGPTPIQVIRFEELIPTHPTDVEPRLALLSAARLQETVAQLSAFKTRHYNSTTGAEASEWLVKKLQTLAKTRTDITVESYKHSFKQPSVIARIRGQGPRANEKIILGAHIDSVNQSGLFLDPSAAAPGADDDASGIATWVEIFRVLVESEFRPDRTLEFIAYAGEEFGLLGSQDIAAEYQNKSQVVGSVLQFDMTSYPGIDPQIILITDFTDPKLTRFISMLMDRYVGAKWGYGKCGYGCSDHASWTEAGYPSAFPFETPFSLHNPSIHTANDTIENGLDFTYGLHFAKMGLAYAIELSAK